MNRIKLNDHYFIAWLNIVKEINYQVEDNKILVDMTSNEYTMYLEEYKETHKPTLSKIRKIVKELNILTSKA